MDVAMTQDRCKLERDSATAKTNDQEIENMAFDKPFTMTQELL